MAESRKIAGAYSKEREEKIRRFWKEKNIPGKARALSAKNRRTFYFMDGPPYATGHIHMGTALNKILKDVSMRSKRMQGFDVFDRPGYDTHGMPIELQVERKKGFRTKQDIEKFGVKDFVRECRAFATKYIGIMNQEFENLGVWMDWDNPFKTLETSYIESIWFTFKKAYDQDMIYQGLYPVHVCPRCETVTAYNEIEYVKQTDEAVYVKFKVKGTGNKFLVIWTTTPWTLPGNTGVMVHPNFEYVEAKLGSGETWIVAKELLQGLMDAVEAGYTVVKEFKGKELEGLEYENPLGKHLDLEPMKGAYRVILSERYVHLDDGTGLVHTAPGHGKEDFDAGKRANLPGICPVEMDGSMTKEAGKYAGKKARIVDEEIVKDLEKENALVYKHPYTHDYPVCWRCKSPLLMVSIPQWFISIKSIQGKALKENDSVYWVPKWMHGRMKDWLETLSDWPVTRSRYWGAPCPLWICKKCGEKKVVGSVAELRKLAGLSENFDPHKPNIDRVTLDCKCGGKMKRIPEILDVWFDSGVSSWGALNFPLSTEPFNRYWPADLNIEATEQVRGWWNSELLCSLITFDKKPFKSILTHGMVLDIDKRKMSKSAGEIVQPHEVIERYNRDYLRHYLIGASKGTDFSFDWGFFRDINRFYNIFWNAYNYGNTYLKLRLSEGNIPAAVLEKEDKWLLSRLNSLIRECTEAYDKYLFFNVVSAVENFVLEDFSRFYIKLVRGRIGTKTQKGVETAFGHTMMGLLKLMAPIAPHITESVYQEIKHGKMPESVHLLTLPKENVKMLDLGLEKEMELAQQVIQRGLGLREKHKMKLRWPLKQLVVKSKTGKELRKVKGVLAKAVNVKSAKEVTAMPKGNFAKAGFEKLEIFLDLDVSDALKDEWEFMELRRKIQEMRKEKDLKPGQKVKLLLGCDDKRFLKKFRKEIEKSTNTRVKEKQGKLQKLLNKGFFIKLDI